MEMGRSTGDGGADGEEVDAVGVNVEEKAGNESFVTEKFPEILVRLVFRAQFELFLLFLS